jgi:DNA-directed RNA polymerase
MTEDTLHLTQVAIEKAMREDALSRLQRDNQKATRRAEWSDSRMGKVFVRRANSDLHLPISEFMSGPEKRAAGRQHIAGKLLSATGIEAEVIAYLTTKAIFNSLTVFAKARVGVKRSSLCSRIGDIIHDEWRVRVFANSDYRKALLKKLFKDFDKRSYPREWRKRTILNYFHAEQVEWQGWTKAQKVHIGRALMEIFAAHTNQIEISKDGLVYPTEALVAQIQHLAENGASFMMLFKPMVVKPRPWTEAHLFRGNYLSKEVKRTPIIKGAGKRDIERFGRMDWSRVLPAINALNETPWRVNRDMLEALTWSYYQHGGNIGKLARADEEPFPPMPDDYDTNEEVAKRHNRECFLVRDRRRQEKTKRIHAVMTISVAREFAQYDAVYFPHNLDSRGRAYPLPSFLNPQGPDFAKALLEFAKGEPIENLEQAQWLAIAGANAYGNDKVSLEERVKWVHDNEDMILSIANNYREDRRWMLVSEPFQFLRFCFEWATFKAEGYGFLSHMVVPVDATCSGLQHYAAMLRDEIGGKSVNLIPGYARQDIYGDVAKVALQKLAEDGSEIAQNLIKFGVDRKTTKRQVMVVPYAGKFASCLAYTREALDEKLQAGQAPTWDIHDGEIHNAHITLLSKAIWDSISEVVVKGKEAMQWLSKLASEFSKAQIKGKVEGYAARMTWVTPDGFEVVHYRDQQERSLINTNFDGRVQLVIYEGNGRLDSKDMALAVAPNFVHSMDACHLRMTIMRGLAMGITDYGMVHDSFGVHARHMARFLAEAVKPAFIEMYSRDTLGELRERFRDKVTVDPPPAHGRLDLEAIQQSAFFFS